jgi:iron complex transport system permease protein
MKLGLACLILVGVFMMALALGSVRIPFTEIVAILTGGQPSQDAYTTILLQFRLPKALTALLAGAALAVGGLQMQTLFRNPLTDPFVLGVSSGASLGVALVVLAAGSTGSLMLAGLGLIGDFGIISAAVIGSAAVCGLVLWVAQRVPQTLTLLILGIMIGYAVGAAVSLLLYFSVAERIQSYLRWTFGSFGGVTWAQMRLFAPTVLLGLVISWALSKPLNGLLLGETYARSMGVAIRRTRTLIILATALLAGAVTAFCGPIGFLGLAVPHLCRGVFQTADHRILIPAAAIVGGAVAIFADILTVTPGNGLILPLNAITALFGAPIVIWIILRGSVTRSGFG